MRVAAGYAGIMAVEKGGIVGDLTKNFNRSEFACKGANCCGHSAPVSMRLVYNLQALRTLIGQPLAINSGFRCNKHNKAVGGAQNSQHIYGTAADIATPKGWTAKQLYDLAESLMLFDGIGIYDWGIHVDVRGTKTRWDYRKNK